MRASRRWPAGGKAMLRIAVIAPAPWSRRASLNCCITDRAYIRIVKILYVSQYFPPEMGAPAARVAELSRHWARMGHDVTVLTGFPNHPTGVVPEEWRSRLHRLHCTDTIDGVKVVRTWLWPLPNRKAHER